MNHNIPSKCGGCGAPLLLENLFVDDGCPCNTPRGVNFTPKMCNRCHVDHCVKPGHRLAELFGPHAVSALHINGDVKCGRGGDTWSDGCDGTSQYECMCLACNDSARYFACGWHREGVGLAHANERGCSPDWRPRVLASHKVPPVIPIRGR